MKVLKFGGTSVGTTRALEYVRDIVMSHEEPVIVVVSALSGMTDQLVELSKTDKTSARKSYLLDTFGKRYAELTENLIGEDEQAEVLSSIATLLDELRYDIDNRPHDEYFQDRIISYGERLSSLFISRIFGSKDTVLVPVPDLIYTTDDNRSVDKDKTFVNINAYFQSNYADIYVVPGFIASAPDGHITNLGRGGSDLTAAILARALRSKKIEIWTDVDGYMTADPRKDPTAKHIPSLTYSEALEMSLHGAKVVYAPALEIMEDVKIPLTVRNTFNPEGAFTSVY